MAYAVDLTARAERDLLSIYDYIHASDSEAAARWYLGLRRAVLSLEQFPNRCAATPENKKLRHLLYGRKPGVYRVIFRVL